MENILLCFCRRSFSSADSLTYCFLKKIRKESVFFYFFSKELKDEGRLERCTTIQGNLTAL